MAAGDHYGWISLVPALSVFALAIYTKRTFEALLGGTLIGYVIVAGSGFFGAFTGSLLAVMAESTIGWIILVVGLFGSLISLLVKSGGALAFADVVTDRVRSRRGSLLVTWLLGLLIFLDDYLIALTLGTVMRPVTDRFKVAREKLAYVVDSTAAPVCVLIPLSTWAIYVAGLLESNGVAPTGEGISTYVGLIPYVTYAWAAVLLVPFVAARWIPDFGPMRAAEDRAARGELAPPGSKPFGTGFSSAEGIDKPRLVNFVLPLVSLVGATWYFDIDVLRGVMVAVAVAVALISLQRLVSVKELSETLFDGFQTMVYPLAIVVMSFVLRNVNDDLGLTQYVIEVVRPVMSGALLPVVAFLSLSLVTFATGSFWGVYAVSFPIIIPLAQSMDVNMSLTLGAVVSAGAFGSHACFYGDATVLSASSSECNIVAHAVTQLPYALVAAGISAGLYLLLGYAL
jgi:tetracycline resistance efflux pump